MKPSIEQLAAMTGTLFDEMEAQLCAVGIDWAAELARYSKDIAAALAMTAPMRDQNNISDTQENR